MVMLSLPLKKNEMAVIFYKYVFDIQILSVKVHTVVLHNFGEKTLFKSLPIMESL